MKVDEEERTEKASVIFQAFFGPQHSFALFLQTSSTWRSLSYNFRTNIRFQVHF